MAAQSAGEKQYKHQGLYDAVPNAFWNERNEGFNTQELHLILALLTGNIATDTTYELKRSRIVEAAKRRNPSPLPEGDVDYTICSHPPTTLVPAATRSVRTLAKLVYDFNRAVIPEAVWDSMKQWMDAATPPSTPTGVYVCTCTGG